MGCDPLNVNGAAGFIPLFCTAAGSLIGGMPHKYPLLIIMRPSFRIDNVNLTSFIGYLTSCKYRLNMKSDS